MNWGDLTACLAALAKAEQRMQRLAQRYGIDAVRGAITATIDRTERITRDVLRRIPAGEYRFIDYFEDDYISDLPVRLALKLTARGDGTVELDFTGSDPQVRAALNLPTGSMRHHPFLSFGLTSFVVTQSEAIHINAGIIRCIDLVLPEASVVNSRFPASCGMRITTAMRIHDMVLGALAQALPGTVPAGGGNTLVITYISTSELGTQGAWWWPIRCPRGPAAGRIATAFPAPISPSRSCAMCRWRCWSPRRRCWCAGSACCRTPRDRGDTAAGSGWNTNWRSAIRAPSW